MPRGRLPPSSFRASRHGCDDDDHVTMIARRVRWCSLSAKPPQAPPLSTSGERDASLSATSLQRTLRGERGANGLVSIARGGPPTYHLVFRVPVRLF